MAWSTAEVARMSGVTSRTLRHYDAIGLLSPAWTGANGYRFYETGQLLRLQQILLLRRLGVGLDDIAAALGSGPDTLTALRRHHARLLAERDRLGELARTAARTITELESQEGDTVMTQPRISRPENLFEGFDPAGYEGEARERWPERAQAVAGSMPAAETAPEPVAAAQQKLTAQLVRMAELMVAGKPAADPEVQAVVDEHYHWVSWYWTPTAGAYRNLGRMYADDERFRASYEQLAAGLAEYQRDAMAVYARDRLTTGASC